MSVWDKEIIPATTAAVISGQFNTVGTVTIMSDQITVRGQTVTLQQTRDGSTWTDVILNGKVQTLNRKHNQITISGPGLYRVVKTGTTTPIGVTLWRTESK